MKSENEIEMLSYKLREFIRRSKDLYERIKSHKILKHVDSLINVKRQYLGKNNFSQILLYSKATKVIKAYNLYLKK